MGNLYENILELCADRNVKPTEMCRKAGITKNTMTELKMGRIKSLSTAKLEKVAAFFGVPVTRLLHGRSASDNLEDALENLRAEERALLQVTRGMTADQVAAATEFIRKMKNDN